MNVRFPYRLSASSSSDEIAANIKALIDVLHHGLDGSNVLLSAASHANLHTVAMVSSYAGGAGNPNALARMNAPDTTIFDWLFASSIWLDDIAGGGHTYRHQANTTALQTQAMVDQTHSTFYQPDDTVRGSDGIRFEAAGIFYEFDRTAGAGAQQVCAIGWIKRYG